MPKTKNEMLEEFIAELRKTGHRTWYKPDTVWVYAEPKCPYCDETRTIHAVAANGQELEDNCRCSELKKEVWTVAPVEIDTFCVFDMDNVIEILPSKTHVSGEVIRSWWADPDADDEQIRNDSDKKGWLYNSLFSSVEKFEEFCKKTGISFKTSEMEEENSEGSDW